MFAENLFPENTINACQFIFKELHGYIYIFYVTF